MTRTRAAFHIMIGFMCVDNEIVEPEIKEIVNYIKDHFKIIDFDPVLEVRELSQIDRAGRIDVFARALAFLSYHITLEQKNDLVESIVDMIVADKIVRDSEGFLFDLVRKEWGIDVKSRVKLLL